MAGRAAAATRFAAAVALLVVAGLAALPSAEWQPLPPTEALVIDSAEVVPDAVERSIFSWLQELHERTGAQVKVVTWADIGALPLTSAAFRQAEAWKLGGADADDGVLIALALAQREVRIEVGYGLEGALPDSWCGSLSRAAAGEHFKRGDYGGGLAEMARAVAHRIAEERGVDLTGVPAASLRPGERGGGRGWIWIIVIGVLMVLSTIGGRHRRRSGQRVWGGAGGWFIGAGAGGWSSGGGGFSGGSFGGFSGGGGGFGGGGGGASW